MTPMRKIDKNVAKHPVYHSYFPDFPLVTSSYLSIASSLAKTKNTYFLNPPKEN